MGSNPKREQILDHMYRTKFGTIIYLRDGKILMESTAPPPKEWSVWGQIVLFH